MKISLLTAFAIAALALSGCALPPKDTQEQGFVPGEELDVVSLVRQGLSAYQKNRYVDAEFLFRQALYLSPKAANVKANLAAALRSTGQFDEAEDILISLNAAAPESLDYLSGLGRLYVDRQEFATARRYYSQAFDTALKKGDFDSASRFARNLAAVAFRIGDESAALCQSQMALQLKPDADAYVRHARLLLGMNRAADARALLSGYLSASGSQSGPVVALALSELALGNNDRALQLGRSVETSSDLPRDASEQLKKIIALAKKNLGQSDPTADSKAERPSSELASQTRADREIEATRSSLYWPSTLLDAISSSSAPS